MDPLTYVVVKTRSTTGAVNQLQEHTVSGAGVGAGGASSRSSVAGQSATDVTNHNTVRISVGYGQVDGNATDGNGEVSTNVDADNADGLSVIQVSRNNGATSGDFHFCVKVETFAGEDS